MSRSALVFSFRNETLYILFVKKREGLWCGHAFELWGVLEGGICIHNFIFDTHKLEVKRSFDICDNSELNAYID